MTITRRAAMSGTLTAAVVAAATTHVLPPIARDPVLALRHRREALREQICALPKARQGDAAANRLVCDMVDTELELMQAEPTTLAGALAQVEQLALWLQDGEPFAAEGVPARLIEALPDRIALLERRAAS